ncbi:MAG: hypothetical protein HYR56_28010 [Acidobacteria bacterium]|nr:hypothetical protein [Acidobacteriota bacterium]MBI3427391.1 hypothetical protein [Acidobacteriota bacterium]
MPAIGIIDDRRKLRHTLVLKLSTQLPPEWQGIEADPLPELSAYPGWISENEISALIVDERLHEQAPDSHSHVGYNGHDLVDFLRKRYTSLPIFIITSHDDDAPLQRRFKDVEGIIARDEFNRNAQKYVPRITRASQQYFETVQKQLTELSAVASKIATGKATKKDKDRAKALQIHLQTPFTDQPVDRSEWLGKMEDELKELGHLKEEIESFLKKKKKP